MPPASANKNVTPEQVAILKRWTDLPEASDPWARQPIDGFVPQRLRAEGLRFGVSSNLRHMLPPRRPGVAAEPLLPFVDGPGDGVQEFIDLNLLAVAPIVFIVNEPGRIRTPLASLHVKAVAKIPITPPGVSTARTE
jgi:hypothetical protein